MRRVKGVTSATLLGPLALLLLSTTALAAQEPRDEQAADSVDFVWLPGLLVRALRAPMAADELPYSLTVREERGPATFGLSLDENLPAVPGLQIHSRYNHALGDRIVVRGFGARAQFGVRGVYLLVDGIPATLPDGQTTLNHLDLGLLERAEILRGPAAAVHGNAVGGVLLLETREPPAAALRQEVSAVTGGQGLYRLRTTTGGRASRDGDDADTGAGWILSLGREWRDGFRPHSDSDRWQLTGRGDLALGGGRVRISTHAVSYDAHNPGSLTFEQYVADPRQAQAFNVVQATGEDGRHAQVGATWERPLGAGLRLETTLYGMARSVDNPIPPAIIDLERAAGGARVLLGSAPSTPRDVSWATGVDAALQRDERRNFENLEGAPGGLTLDQTDRVTNLALHGQALVPLAGGLGLFAGARYDRVAFSAEDRLVTAGNPDDSGDRRMHALSPSAGLRVVVTPGVSLFGNLATAFETPTTTELVNRPDGSGGFNQALDPQRTVSVELGGHASIGRFLRLQANVYRARVEDALVPFEVEAAPGRQFFRNAGSAVHAGAELLAELRTERLEMLLAVDRTNAEFSSYATADAAFDGNDVPGVRPWTVGLSVLARSGRLALAIDYEGVGRMAVDDANQARAPAHYLFGLRLAAQGPSFGSWRLEPYAGVENLFDRRHVASVVPNAFGDRFFEPGPGRTLYLGVEFGHDGGR